MEDHGENHIKIEVTSEIVGEPTKQEKKEEQRADAGCGCVFLSFFMVCLFAILAAYGDCLTFALGGMFFFGIVCIASGVFAAYYNVKSNGRRIMPPWAW